MTSIRRLVIERLSVAALIAAMISLHASALPSQFIAHPPSAQSDSSARVDEMRRGMARAIPRELAARLKARSKGEREADAQQLSQADLASLGAAIVKFCADRWPSSRDECERTLDAAQVAKWKDAEAPSGVQVLLALTRPGAHERSDVRRYLSSFADSGGARVFGQFAANLGENEALVSSDVVSGLAGRTLFAITYTGVVVKSDSGSPEVRDRIAGDKGRLLRMLNNGGSVTARLAWPMHARQGPTFRQASMAVFNLGLVGPLGRSDSLRASASVAIEFVSALSIRDISERAGTLGDIYFAIRAGPAVSETRILAESGHKNFLFGQIGFGLRQGNSVGLTAMVTYLSREEMRRITPRLVFNLSAIR